LREVGFTLRRHGIEKKAQGGFYVFSIDTVVLLVGSTASVIDDAVKHEGGVPFPFKDPGGFLDLFEIGRTQVELPTVVTVVA
jgi:hypothetical protein